MDSQAQDRSRQCLLTVGPIRDGRNPSWLRAQLWGWGQKMDLFHGRGKGGVSIPLGMEGLLLLSPVVSRAALQGPAPVQPASYSVVRSSQDESPYAEWPCTPFPIPPLLFLLLLEADLAVDTSEIFVDHYLRRLLA